MEHLLYGGINFHQTCQLNKLHTCTHICMLICAYVQNGFDEKLVCFFESFPKEISSSASDAFNMYEWWVSLENITMPSKVSNCLAANPPRGDWKSNKRTIQKQSNIDQTNKNQPKINQKSSQNRSKSIKNRSQRRFRSEERRVGKECRSRWSPYH